MEEKTEKKESVKIEPKIAKVKEVQIQFKENRKFDLHIGRSIITFKGNESKVIPINWLDHKDFKQVEYMFNIRRV